jgi:hypothetical protein
VVQIFEYCLADKVKKLGNEKLIILEQVFIAALDCGRIKLAEDCIRVLISEFPESLRIMKLKAMVKKINNKQVIVLVLIISFLIFIAFGGLRTLR